MSAEEKHSDNDLFHHHGGYSNTTSYDTISLLKVHSSPNPRGRIFRSNATHRSPSRTRYRILIPLLLVSISLYIVTRRFCKLRRPLPDETLFDCIIVGAGPAGLVVATELARKRPAWNIVIFESGSVSQTSVLRSLQQRTKQPWEEDSSTTFVNELDIPLFWSGAATNPHHHWGMELLGKAIGGSAIHNAMLYVRSLASDWNDIDGWDYESLEHEYVGMERYVGNNDITIHRPTGWNGRLTTSPPILHDAIAPLFVEAASNAGLHLVDTFNRNDTSRTDSVGYYEFNIRNGVRDSVAAAVLRDGIPDNLRIETGATVTRVLLGLNQRAVGVEYVQDGDIGQCLLAPQGEVILSAGALLTPQLLHNSGFNFTYTVKDHPVVTVGFNVDAEMTAIDAQSSLYLIGHELNQYRAAVEQLSNDDEIRNATETSELQQNIGALGTSGFSAGAFLRSPWADATTSAPDLQLTVFPQEMEPHVMQDLKRKHKRNPTMLITIALLQPDAKYELLPSASDQPLVASLPKLNKENSLEYSRIKGYRLPKLLVPNNGSKEDYLSDRDAKRLAWGIEQVRKIQQTKPLSLHTGPEVFPASSKEDLITHVRRNHLANSHWVQSTPLGSSMVDARLRVSENLRIVDAGVLPMVPNGNIHSTVCVVASRAAKLILRDRDDIANGKG